MAEDTLAALANVRPQRKPSLADLQALLALPQGDPRNDFGRATGTARSVMHGAVVQPLQEIAHGISDLATGEGFTRNVGEGANSLVGLMAGGLGGVTPAIFGGVMAKTANKAALSQAERMAAQGADRAAILNQTGWFKGGDNKWRFEISDDASFVQPGVHKTIAAGQPSGTLGDTMQHMSLYKAYPSLRDVVQVDANVPKGTGGLSRGNSIGIAPDQANNPQTMHSILLHETQHEIQNAEQFARGGNPDTFIRENMRAVRDAEEQITTINERLKAAAGTPKYEELLTLRQELVNQINSIQGRSGFGAQEKGFDRYHRLAGEVEARNVQRRQLMAPEQRRAMPPWDTEDVPLAQQIFR